MIRIYGASDDLVYLEGDIQEEIGAIDKPIPLTVGRAEATHGQNAAGLIVTMRYGANRVAVWGATISQIDEDIPMPWSVSVKADGYSVIVDVDCPPGTPVWWPGKDGDDEDDEDAA